MQRPQHIVKYILVLLISMVTACNNHRTDLYCVPEADQGILQSPINILTSDLRQVGSNEFDVIFGEQHHSAEAIINKGHTIEIDFEPGDYVVFEEDTFELIQCHFHTPSEHMIDGITFPMEIHVVNKNINENGKTKYLVLAALFKMGTSNLFIEEFINMIPESEGEMRSLSEKDHVFLEDLKFGDGLRHYYHYKGSLTTPPYTESVHWVILRGILQATPEQILHINELEGNNARKVQAQYRRMIERNL